MRPILTQAVPAMETPSPALRAAAAASGGDRVAHDAMMSDWRCMTTIELAQPPAPLPAPRPAPWARAGADFRTSKPTDAEENEGVEAGHDDNIYILSGRGRTALF